MTPPLTPPAGLNRRAWQDALDRALVAEAVAMTVTKREAAEVLGVSPRALMYLQKQLDLPRKASTR